jgi:hypothetical protein
MLHEYIKGTRLTKEDAKKIKLQIIAVRLSCNIQLTRQQMYDWNNSTTEEHYEAYESIETNKRKVYEKE